MQKPLLLILLATILLVANSTISLTSFLTGSSTGNTVPDITFVSTDPYTQSDDYRSGSLAGQTLIYIKASGLPADITLNTVFVGGVSCPIEPTYTSTLQVACYTPSSKTFGNKEVALYVGSNKATCSAAVCYFNYVTSKTPIFQYIVPNTMNPDSIVNFGGAWKVQDGYLLQINLNQYVCDSVSIGHQLLDPNNVDFIKCGTGPLDAGQYMANANAFLMGNALQLNTAYNSRDSSGTFYNFTILPQIDSLSSNQGTTAGEVLTIIGSGFSNQPTDMEVYFGNTSCIVMSSVYNSIQCHLIKPAVIDQVGIMPGHPGLKLRTFSAFSSLAALQLSSDFTQGGGAKSQVLSAETPYDQGTAFSESMQGFFKAPSTGSYTFMLSSGGPSQLYVAESSVTSDNLVLAAEVFNTTDFRDFYNPNEAAQMSRTFQFEQDNYYYIQAIHLSGNPDHMTVGVIVPNNGPRQYNSLRKVLSVKINANVVMQQITFRLKKNVLGLLYQFGARQGTSPTVVRTATFAYPGTSATVESLWASLGYPVKVVNRTLISATGAVVTTDALSTYVNYTVIFQNYSSFSSTNKPSGFPMGYLDVYLDNTPTALLTGAFSLSLLGQTFTVSYDQTAESLRYILQSLTGVGMPRVTRYGIPQTGCEWIIQFDGNEEDLPSLTVASQGNLIGGSVGSLSLSVQVIQNSNSSDLLFSPIPYNMLFTAEEKPQITVKTRGFPASCPSWGCDYYVEEVIVPIVQNFTLNGDILEIYLTDGEGLTAADLNVVFADIMAQVISYDPDTQEIVAQIPLNDAGAPLIVAGIHIPTVIVDSVQILDTAPEVTGVLIEPTIASVDVITSGISDGYIAFDIHGSGYGYYQPDPYNTFVTVGGQECYVVTLTNSETLCYIDGITYNGTVNLTVNGLWTTYELNVTQPSEPELPFEIISHTVDPSSAENTFVIQGNDFDNTTSITLSNQDTSELVICNVCSFNSTIITCLTSAIPPGNYTLVATTHVPPTDIIQETTYIDLPLEIYSVVPDAGSQMGGTILTITGKGFSTIVNDNQVSYGHMNYQCNVIDANDTVITCETSANIYDCEETEFQNVTVLQRLEYVAECKGNCTFRYLNDYTPTIYNVSHTEVLAGDSLTITGKNFTSETQIKISGVLATVLTVQSDEITIQVPSIEAGQGLQVTGYDPTFGNFIYVHDILVNHTLKALDFSPKNGSLAGSVLTIDGKGFSALATVTVGATACQVLSVTPSTLTCKTAANAQGPVVVTQGDYTETITTDNFTSTESYTPSITGISGLPISVAATEIVLTLEGQSLDIDTPITVALVSDLLSYQGEVVSSDTASIQVRFVNVSAGIYTLSAQVGAHITSFTSVSTTVDVPLNVNTVTPVVSSLAGGVQLEITGAGFSIQPNAQTITVEGFPCSVVSASFDNIVCTVPPFISQATQSTYSFGQEALLSGTYFSNGANENVSTAFDNTTLTYFVPNSANSNCAFGIDFGEGLIAQLTQIQYFPKANIDYTRLSGSLIEASIDGVTYVTISQLGTNVYDGWNTIASPMTGQSAAGFRYLRFRKNTASSKCEIAELKVRGILLSALQVNDTTSIQATAKLTVNGKSVSLPNAVEYRADKTPVITSVNPKVGSGKGNTLITLSGTDLDQVNQVQIDNIICAIQSVTSTEVTCITGSLPPVSERRERVTGLINAYTPQGKVSADGVNFLYAEKWSDRDTWGCGGFPKESDSVHVEVGMNLLIDVSPPKLVAVVVEGALIFDDADIQFAAEYILIRNGFLQIGTESEPIQSNIDITLYGARADAQLPIFGNKVIAVYEGVVDIHGAPRVISTTLAATADANQTQIQVTDPVGWRVGEKIAISSTSSDSAQTEERVIVSITSTTIELDQPLSYIHTVTQATIDGNNYQTTCEVILLSRNIQIKGDDYSSDQNSYGAHMMFYDPGTESTIIRISYTEITRAGQAGYLGRFPINFQHAGNQMNSYLKGNSIHHTYQRGIQLQGTHYLTVQQNVVYQARGYGINLENGIERFNVFEDNIVLSCQSVLQYLSTQESPVGFRISNPTNFFRRNKAISNPTLGFWFDLQSSTSGAYSSNSICPNGERLGAFEDNIAAWNGDDGIKFGTYIPRTYPCRQVQYTNQADPFANNAPITAVFKNTVVFGNTDNGVEAYTVGAVVFDGLIAFENGVAGIDISFSQAPINGTQIINSVFIGSFTSATSTADYRGIRLARSEGLYIQNCTFANFAASKPALEIDSRYYYNYYYDSGARTVFLTQLTFINVTLRVNFYNSATHILVDLDGSLTELTNGGTVVNNLPHLANLTGCTVNQTFFNGLVCDTNTVFRRVVFYSLNPSTIYGRNLEVLRLYDTLDETNRSSTEYTALPYRYGRNPDASYALPFALGHSYKVFFDGQTDFVSMVFDLSPHWSSSDPAVDFVFNHTAPREDFDVFRWDRIQGTANVENSTELWNVFEPSTVTGKYLGDWYHDVNQSNLFMHVIGGNGTRCTIKGYECRVNCPLPPPGPATERVIVYWSNQTIWPGQILPREGDNIVVPWNWTLIMDINPPPLDTVEIQGELRFDAGHGENIFIAKKIWVRGLLTIGSESGAFTEKATIILTGTRNEDGLLINGVTEAGTKVIGVSGQIAIYGQVVTEKVSLVETLYPNTRVVKTSGNLIGWEVGHHIAVTTTEKDAVYEVFEIESISGSDITVTTPAQYLHYSGVFTNTVDGLTHNIDFSSEVILLNRSVTIQGSREDNWGGRLIVTEEYYDTYTQTGKADLHYVAFDYMGQGFDKSGLSFEYMSNITDNGASVVESTVMTECLGWGVRFLYSQSISFFSNTILTSRQFGIIFMESNSYVDLVSNHVFNVILDAGVMYTYIEGVSAGIYLNDLTANIVTLSENVVGGCEIAYLIEAVECNIGSPYSNNVAHSSNIGFLMLTDQDKCHEISSLTAYRSDFGVLSYFSAPQIVAHDLLLSDNKVSIHINAVGSDQDQKILTVKDSLFVAFAIKDCPTYYTEASCSSNAAIMLGVATEEGKQLPPRIQDRPWEVINSDASFNSQQIFTNNTFVNFIDGILPQCHNNFVLKTSQYASDYTPYSTVGASHLTDVSINRLAYFDIPVAEQRCGNIPCTGLQNVLIKDDDGTLTGNRGSIVPNNAGIINQNLCYYVSDSNGYICTDESLAILEFESLDTDKNTRVISPVYITNTNGFSNTLNAFKAHDFSGDYTSFHRLARFPSIIQMNNNYKIEFSGTLPNTLQFAIEGAQSTDSTILKINYYDPQVITVYNATSNTMIHPVPYQFAIDAAISTTDPCGTNYFDRTEKTINFLLTADPACKLAIMKTNVLAVNIRYDMTEEEFWQQGGSARFIDKVASVLGISHSTIRVISITKGSVILAVEIVSEYQGVSQTPAAAAELNGFGDQLQAAYAAGDLNVYDNAKILNFSQQTNLITDGTQSTDTPQTITQGHTFIIAAAVGAAVIVAVLGGFCVYKYNIRRRQAKKALKVVPENKDPEKVKNQFKQLPLESCRATTTGFAFDMSPERRFDTPAQISTRRMDSQEVMIGKNPTSLGELSVQTRRINRPLSIVFGSTMNLDEFVVSPSKRQTRARLVARRTKNNPAFDEDMEKVEM